MSIQGAQLRIAAKNPCRVATTANVNLTPGSSPDVVDGITLTVGDRILVKDQTVGAGNGIYQMTVFGAANTSTWARAEDFDAATQDHIRAGANTYIQEGSVNAQKTYTLTTTGTITLGSTSLTFVDTTATVGDTRWYKQPVRVATTGNIATLAGGAPNTVDGVTVAVNDRILVRQQSTPAQNGIYRVQTVGTGSNGTWTRASDFNNASSDRITAGVAVVVQEGSTLAKKHFVLTTTGTITIGSTSLTFEVGFTAGAASVTGSAGTVDNALVRADGTGGSTVQGGAASNNVLLNDTGDLYPEANDGGALGLLSSNQWSDLFLASGADISWDNNDTYIRHSADALSFYGAGSGYAFLNTTSPNYTLTLWNGTGVNGIWSTSGVASGHGSTHLAMSFNGSQNYTHRVTSQHSGASDAGNSISFLVWDLGLAASTVADTVAMSINAAGQLDLPISGSVISFANGDVTITHSADALAFAGAASGYDFDNPFFLVERASALVDQAGKGQLWVRNDTPNVLVFTDDGGTDWVLNTAGGSQTNAVYVSKAGNNSNDGLSINSAKLTIASAITAASGLTPSTSNRITIFILDGGIYTESITLPAYVSLIGPGATIAGSSSGTRVTMGTESTLHIHRVDNSAGASPVNVSATSAGPCWVYADEIENLGTSASFAHGILCNNASAEVHINIGKLVVSSGNGLFENLNGRISGWIGELYISGTGRGVVLSGSSGGQVDLHIGRLYDNATATAGIELDATGQVANIVVGELDTNTTYAVATGATLNLLATKITGTPGTVNGVANVTEAGSGSFSETTQTNAVYVSKAGNNGNDGLSINAAKLTIASAVTAASGLSPAVANPVAIYILDADIYDETADLPNYVSLIGPAATVTRVFPGTDSTVVLDHVNSTAGADAFFLGDAGDITIRVNRITATSTADCIQISATVNLFLDVGRMEVVDGAGLFSNSVSAVTHGHIGDIVITGTGKGLDVSGAAFLTINRIEDSGSGTGIEVNLGGNRVVATVSRLDCNTTYNVLGILRLIAGEIVGTPGTVSGTLTLLRADTGAVGGSSGAVDNSLIRADGTGGSTVQGGTSTFEVLLTDTGRLYPATSGNVWLGDATSQWGNLFIAANGVVNFAAGDVTLTHATNTLSFQGATSGYAFDSTVRPFVTDGAALGSSTLQWSDLFLASGGVINFADGDVTLTHSADALTFAGAASGYDFDNPFFLAERASALVDQAGKGQLWVRNDTPNVLVFTDDGGTDWVLNTAGGSLGGSTGAADNAILRADGVGGSTVQASGVTIDDSDNIAGADSITMVEQASAPVTPGSGNGAFWVQQGTNVNLPAFTDENALDVSLVRSVVLTRSMPSTAADSVELGSFTNSTCQSFSILVHTGTSTSNDFVAYHRVLIRNPVSTGGFVIHQPLHTSGPLNGTTFGDLVQIEINVAVGGAVSLRARSYIGVVQTVTFRLVLDGDDTGVFTPSSTQATTTAPTTNFSNSMLTMTDTVNSAFGGTGVVAWKPFYFEERAAADSDIAGFGQLWVRNDTPNVLVFTDDGGTDHELGLTPVTQTNAVYVSKAGNNANDGLSEETPKLTISSAITAANGLTPSSSSPVTIRIMDAGVYAETALVLPDYVSLDGPHATLTSSGTNSPVLNLGIRSSVNLHRLSRTSASSGINEVLAFEAAGKGWARVDEVLDSSTNAASACVRVNNASAEAYIEIGRIEGSVPIIQQSGTLRGFVGEVRITGTGTGVSQSGGEMALTVDKIEEAATATNGINVSASGAITSLTVGTLDVATAYSVASGGTLNLLAGSLTGSPGTVAGTANVTVAGGGGLGGSTGATDEAVLLADGTGGSTVKSSSLTVANIRDYNPVKRPCVAATGSNIADLSTGAPDTVDGVSLTANARVLVWNQSTPSQNGIYEVTTLGTGSNGTWTRASDFSDATTDYIEAGVEVYVQQGDTFGQVKFILTTTGAITIGSTSLEFIPMGGLVRTDATSTEIQASTTFTVATKWTSTVNMRDHNELAIWFDPTSLNTGGITDVTIVIAWSDDGSTIAFSDGEYNQQTDFNITNQTDGSFKPKTYTANLTSASGELTEGVGVHLSFPKRGGYCRIGVAADAAGGSYTVRAQRLVV